MVSYLYPNLPRNVIVRLSDHRSSDNQDRKRFLIFSVYKLTCNYDRVYTPPSLPIALRSWDWATERWNVDYKRPDLPRNVIVTLSHPQSRDNLEHETFLAPSADKQCHRVFRPLSLPFTIGHWDWVKIKICTICTSYIYINFSTNVRLSYPWIGDSQGKKYSWHPLITGKDATTTWNSQTTIPPNHYKLLRLNCSKVKLIIY